MALKSDFLGGRGDTPITDTERNATTVAALLREREMLVRRGLPDRVAQVDAELARLGYSDIETTTAVPAMETAVVTPTRRPRRSTGVKD